MSVKANWYREYLTAAAAIKRGSRSRGGLPMAGLLPTTCHPAVVEVGVPSTRVAPLRYAKQTSRDPSARFHARRMRPRRKREKPLGARGVCVTSSSFSLDPRGWRFPDMPETTKTATFIAATQGARPRSIFRYFRTVTRARLGKTSLIFAARKNRDESALSRGVRGSFPVER